MTGRESFTSRSSWLSFWKLQIPWLRAQKLDELKRGNCSCRAGPKVREREKKFRPFSPSIIKYEETDGILGRECYVFHWDVTAGGYSQLENLWEIVQWQTDSASWVSKAKEVGLLCLPIMDGVIQDMLTVKEHLCTPDTELLILSFQPTESSPVSTYRKFPSVSFWLWYISCHQLLLMLNLMSPAQLLLG